MPNVCLHELGLDELGLDEVGLHEVGLNSMLEGEGEGEGEGRRRMHERYGPCAPFIFLTVYMTLDQMRVQMVNLSLNSQWGHERTAFLQKHIGQMGGGGLPTGKSVQ